MHEILETLALHLASKGLIVAETKVKNKFEGILVQGEHIQKAAWIDDFWFYIGSSHQLYSNLDDQRFDLNNPKMIDQLDEYVQDFIAWDNQCALDWARSGKSHSVSRGINGNSITPFRWGP